MDAESHDQTQMGGKALVEISSDGALEYKWSRIIRPSDAFDDMQLVWDCRVDTARKKRATSRSGRIAEGADRDGVGFEFLFCPEQFDEEIGLEQFQSRPLDMEAMRQYGIMASVVRQDAVMRAKQVEEDGYALRAVGPPSTSRSREPGHAVDETSVHRRFEHQANQRRHEKLVKRLYRNIEGTAA